MDVLLLSRLQFAATCIFHFLFVPLTLGLVMIVALMETRYVMTKDETYKKMAKFWGKIFVINFAIGVVTGITLEFQLGTNWSKYSAYVGDIFGSLLAIEATLAFFLESTFLAVWVFGWKRLSPKMHCISIWIVAIASTTSAFWILAANAWMQHPVGYVIVNGRAELSNFIEIITQPAALLAFFHTVTGAYALAGFFVLGISGWHLARKQHLDFFKRSFQFGMWFALVFGLAVAFFGHLSGMDVAKDQPAKLAAMESFWAGGTRAPMVLFLWPDEKNEKNYFEAGSMPPHLSILAYGRADAEVKGLLDFPKNERPSVLPVFLGFRIMVGLGTLFIFLAAVSWWWRKAPEDHPKFMRLLLWCIPLPYLAIQAGWVVTEMGRQPWIVRGLMRTEDAVSPIRTSQVATTLIAFIVVYSILGVVNFTLIARTVRRGPLDDANENGGY